MNEIQKYLPSRSEDDDEYTIYDNTIARFLKSGKNTIAQSRNAAIMLKKIYKWVISATKRGKLTNHEKYGPGWVYLTIDYMEQQTTLTRKEQDTAIKILCDHKLIEKQIFGLPPKRHFRLIRENLDKLLWSLDHAHEFKEMSADLPREDKSTLNKCLPICPCDSTRSAPALQITHYIETLEETLKKTPEVAGAPLSADADVLLSLFIQSLKKTKPDIKIPSKLDKWRLEFDRLLRIDKRSLAEVKSIIEWLPTHGFWCTKILSSDTFRRQYDKLALEKSKPKENYGFKRQYSRPEQQSGSKLRVPKWMDEESSGIS